MKTNTNKAEAAPAQVAQHTPGPWHYQDKADAYTHIVRDSNERYVCGCSQDSNGNAKANASLIAAAPELLAALQSCFEMLTSPKFSGWIDANCADDELWAMTQAMIQRRDQARAAIAKAEGKL